MITILLLISLQTFSRDIDRPDRPSPCNLVAFSECVKANKLGAEINQQQWKTQYDIFNSLNFEREKLKESVSRLEIEERSLVKNIELAEKESRFLAKEISSRSDIIDDALISTLNLSAFDLNWLELVPELRAQSLASELKKWSIELQQMQESKLQIIQSLDAQNSSCAYVKAEMNRLESNISLHVFKEKTACKDEFCPQ